MTVKSVESVLKAKGHDVATVWPWSTIQEATTLLAGPPRIGALVVLNEARRVAGLLTEGDVVRGLERRGDGVCNAEVDSLMSHVVPTCGPDDALTAVMQTMTDWRFRHLPVVRGDELVGLISIGDVVRALLRDAQLEVAVLRDVAISHS